MTRYTIRPEPASPTAYTATADGSLPLSLGPILKQNPDRGYRGELYLTLGSGLSYPSWSTSADAELVKELACFQEEKIQVYQLYVYLIEFYNKPLSNDALEQLTRYLDKIRCAGKRVLLRFAYEYDSYKKGPGAKQVLCHIAQLKTWFQNNSKLVDDTVYAMQLGLFGLWGEGHGIRKRSTRSEKNKRRIIAAFFDMVPDTITVMVRTPDYLNLVGEQHITRASIHDDYLIGIEDDWGMIPFDHPDNQALYNMSQHAITDAEMPWGTNNVNVPIDPINLLIQAKNYGLRTFSAKHNYKEDRDGPGKSYYLEEWKSVALTKETLEKNGLPYCPAALNEKGQISIFDYLDTHLGYLLAATNLKCENGLISFDLINYGMGAPLDFAGELKVGSTLHPLSLDMKKLGQFSHTHIVTECPPGCPVAIRLRHIRNHSLTIKLANETDYYDGFNEIVK